MDAFGKPLRRGGAHVAEPSPRAERSPKPEPAPEAEPPASSMAADGYEYLSRSRLPAEWPRLVAEAAEAVSAGLAGKALEAVNSERLQLRFSRSDLPAPLRRCVEALQAQVAASCGAEYGKYSLQDCYALLTPKEEVGLEARAPQRWHLDAIRRFPVAALLLRGGRATEFAAGPYSDFASGVAERQLEAWTASLKHINAHTWDSESTEEWLHFSGHLHAAGLVTGVDAETGDGECDWTKLAVAPTPAGARPGASSIFWSNKAHRGPGTEPGEERLVLFCSWLPRASGAGGGRAKRGRESETDYSFYDGHLEPKLRLTGRAARSNKRHCA